MMSTLDDLVADEALAMLDPARSLLMTTLAHMKPEVAGELARYEAAGAALLARIAPIDLPEGGFARLLAAIAEAPAPPQPGLSHPSLDAVPEPLRAVAAEAIRRRGWRRLMPGIHALDIARVLRPAGVTAQLIRVYPGWSIPRHTHGGEELTLVLSGGFTDETGRFGVGDVTIADPALTHRPVADPGEPCVSYIVSDTQPRFFGGLGVLTRTLDRLQGKG